MNLKTRTKVPLSFEHFVHSLSDRDLSTCSHHYRLQSSLIDLKHIDFIGSYERLEEDFHHVCKQLSIEASGLPHINQHDTQFAFEEVYTSELIDRVHALYHVDCTNFSYEPGDIFS